MCMAKKNILTVYVVLFFTMFKISAGSEVYFSPQDHPKNKLIEMINEATERVYVAVYMITDKDISQALITAKNKGVDVQVVTDKITMESSFGKGKALQKSGVNIRVFNPSTSPQAVYLAKKVPHLPIMHHKFALFDHKKLWTGSFNWTRSANLQNQENVLVTDDKDIYERYDSCFKKLKELCSNCANSEQSEQTNSSLEKTKQFLKSFFRLPKIQ